MSFFSRVDFNEQKVVYFGRKKVVFCIFFVSRLFYFFCKSFILAGVARQRNAPHQSGVIFLLVHDKEKEKKSQKHGKKVEP